MKPYFTYQWTTIRLKTDCTKCGNNIVFQDFDRNPTCNECGNVNKMSWISVLKKADIIRMKNANAETMTMMGEVNANLLLEPVDNISCFHCKTTLEIPPDHDLKNFSCNSCKTSIPFAEFPELEDLVFYKSGGASEHVDAIKMIAVRCVSCGAPLEADPSKTNFNCKFCATDNVLPMSLRYKVVVDDMYVGEKISRFPKLLAFEKDGKIVKQALNENGKASFADAELDKVLLEKMNDVGVYNIITTNFKYLPPDAVLKEMFDTSTNQTIIGLVGTRLQKTKDEIAARIEEVAPQPKQKDKEAKVYYQKPIKKSFFKTPLFYIIVVVVIITALALASGF